MSLFSIRSCDRTGGVLDNRTVDAADVYTALAQANRHLRVMVDRREATRLDPRGRIDVVDREGRIVARLNCAEALAAMSLAPYRAEAAPMPRQRAAVAR